MATLGIPQNTIAVLQKYNFNFQKKFGQNFLTDRSVVESIAEECCEDENSTILEIGPEWHKKKEGTPTMGGLGFILSAVIVFLTVLER